MIYRRLFDLLKVYRKEIGLIYGYALFTGLLSLSLPLGMQAIVNFIMMGQLSTSWVVLSVFLTLALTFYSVFLIFQVHVSEYIQQRIFVKSAFEFVFRLVRIKPDPEKESHHADFVFRFFETTAIQKGISKILLDFSVHSLMILFGLIILSFYHGFFFLFSLALLGIVFLVFRWLGPRGFKSSLEESTMKYKVAHWMNDISRNNEVFKINSSSRIHLDRAARLLDGYINHRNEHFRILKFQYVALAALKVLVISGLLIAGSVLVVRNELNLGQFISSEILVFMIVNSIEKLVYSLDTIYDVLTSLEKYGKVIDAELESPEAPGLVELKTDKTPELRLVDVDIEKGGLVLQKGISFSLAAGDRMALCGRSGTGKTELIYRMATLSGGGEGVFYDGIEASRLNLKTARKYMGLVFSDPKIFEGSLIENICLSPEDLDMDRMHDACSKVGLNDFLKKQEGGYNMKIVLYQRPLPRDIQLKIELARVFYKKPPIVFFDSDLHYLSQFDREQVIENFTRELKDSIFVFNTTSAHTASVCNSLLYLSAGRSQQFFGNITEALRNPEIASIIR